MRRLSGKEKEAGRAVPTQDLIEQIPRPTADSGYKGEVPRWRGRKSIEVHSDRSERSPYADQRCLELIDERKPLELRTESPGAYVGSSKRRHYGPGPSEYRDRKFAFEAQDGNPDNCRQSGRVKKLRPEILALSDFAWRDRCRYYTCRPRWALFVFSSISSCNCSYLVHRGWLFEEATV